MKRCQFIQGKWWQVEDVKPDARIQEQHQPVSVQVIRIVEWIVYYKCTGLFTGSR